MSIKHLNRIAALESALRNIIATAPQQEPEEESYDDTESAYNNGVEVGAWQLACLARCYLDTPPAVTPEEMVNLAIKKLREARDLLAAADAPRSLERVRAALKSAEGAHRNAGYRRNRNAPLSGASSEPTQMLHEATG